jgi:hypothetical protein
MCLCRWLKLIVFIINILSSISLIYIAIFAGVCRPTILDYLKRRVYLNLLWQDIKVSREVNDAHVL